MHFVVYCQGAFFKADIQIIAITIEGVYVQSLKREISGSFIQTNGDIHLLTKQKGWWELCQCRK